MSIKEDSEIRHVLAHIMMAIRANAEGNHKTAIYEIDAVEGLVMWDNEEQMNNYIEDLEMACTMRKTKTVKKPRKTTKAKSVNKSKKR